MWVLKEEGENKEAEDNGVKDSLFCLKCKSDEKRVERRDTDELDERDTHKFDFVLRVGTLFAVL